MITTVLMDHPCACGNSEAKIVDDDSCFEAYLADGKDAAKYDPMTECEHLECTECGAPFN
jgi:hypothetical protein